MTIAPVIEDLEVLLIAPIIMRQLRIVSSGEFSEYNHSTG
jgi:hypothetical protein